MTKNIFLCVIFSILFFGFNINQKIKAQDKNEDALEKTEFFKRIQFQKFLSEIGLQDLVFAENLKKPNATWQMYDSVYLNFLKNTTWQKNEFFKKAMENIHFHIVEGGNLHEDKSELGKAKILFYLNEMRQTNFINPILAIKLLNASSLSKKEKKAYAKNALSKHYTEYKNDIVNFEKSALKETPKEKETTLQFLENYKNSVQMLKKIKG